MGLFYYKTTRLNSELGVLSSLKVGIVGTVVIAKLRSLKQNIEFYAALNQPSILAINEQTKNLSLE